MSVKNLDGEPIWGAPHQYLLAVEANIWDAWNPETRYVVLLECFGIGYQYIRLIQDDDKYIVFYLVVG